MNGPLDGIRVLDFSQVLAGPFCTQNLADLGAEIVKVEPIQGGDLARQSGPFHPADEARAHSGYFHSINRNKKSVAIDLKRPEGVALVKRLVPSFDVVIENFRVGVMDRLGLSFEALSALHPPLVYGAIRGFGDPRSGTSAYTDWPAYDVVAQAMGGMIGITGTGPGAPLKVGPGVGDTVPALYLALGVVSAVLHARRTGQGQFVDVAMVDAVLGVSERIVHQHAFGGLTPGPEGNHHPFWLPFGIYPASDGHIALACPSEKFFQELCRALDAASLMADPRFVDSKLRATHREEVIAAVSKLTAAMTKAQLAARLGGVVPFGPVYDIGEIVQDPYFAVRGMLPQLEVPGLPDTVRVAGQPIKFSLAPERLPMRGPFLGEHTDPVLREAGIASDDIAALHAAGTIN